MLPLTLSGVTVRRKGKVLLGPVDHVLDGPGLTAVIGPNGAGKSTLLRLMHGVERLSEGHTDWAVPLAEARAQQSFVFQSPVLLRRTVAGNLSYPLQLQGVPKAELPERVRTAAKAAGLQDLTHLPANRLSGGERQKMALARALITRPKVLFLDEPCANLDGHATREIEGLLRNALDAGTRIILATHDMGQVRRLASDIIFLLHGKVAAKGPAAMLQTPDNIQLSAFLNGDIIT